MPRLTLAYCAGCLTRLPLLRIVAAKKICETCEGIEDAKRRTRELICDQAELMAKIEKP